MAKRRSNLAGWLIVAVVVLVLVPREILLLWAALAVIVIALVAYSKWTAQKPDGKTPPAGATKSASPTLAELTERAALSSATAHRASRPAVSVSRPSDAEVFFTVHLDSPRSTVASATARAIPVVSGGEQEARWVRPDEVVEVGGTRLPGGLFYFGCRLLVISNNVEPSLIDPRFTVAPPGGQMGAYFTYYQTYAGISPACRRAYLDWLAGGRRDPRVDIGCVFLFFYGLERRVLFDSRTESTAQSDWPLIAAELRRLIALYGGVNRSFLHFARGLLDWVELDPSQRLYTLPVPPMVRSQEMAYWLRLALGQTVLDHVPVSPALALGWARVCPDVMLSGPARRCTEVFDRLFLVRYQSLHDHGLMLPTPRTKLVLHYRAASGAFLGSPPFKRTFGEVPDVSALTAPLKKLQSVVDRCTLDLTAYSRLVGRNPEAASSLEGALLLPSPVWPEAAHARLLTLVASVRSGMRTMTFAEVLSALGGHDAMASKESAWGLAHVLAVYQVGMEPDVLGGARWPKARDPVVLFATDQSEDAPRRSGDYHAAVLSLQLASASAHANGGFNASELSHLRDLITSWTHLPPADQTRLLAYLGLLSVAPMTLPKLKKRLEPLDGSAREAIARFMVALAHADGIITPGEMRFLEKLYKTLGVDVQRVFGDVHAIGTNGATESRRETSGFTLDAARIASLQRETAAVSSLLAGIFTETDPEQASSAQPGTVETEPNAVPAGLLGMDLSHSALARLMLSRPQWSRAELTDAATDLGLMLDGALETLNEACFDAYDAPMTEGDDPVEINMDTVEKLTA